MDIIEQLIKEAQKEMQKIQIQVKGLISAVNNSENQTRLRKDAKQEVTQAKRALLKNSSELKGAIKGQFADKVSETFEKQKEFLSNF